MKKEYFCTWGCHLDMDCVKAIVTYPDEMSDADFEEALSRELYELAYQATEGWIGSHGFADFTEAAYEEEGIDDAIHEEIENAIDYSHEVWNEDKHDCQCFRGPSGKVSTIEIDF